MKIEELVGSLQTYEYSVPPVKKAKTISLKASKKKARVSSEEDFDNEEDTVAMLAKNFGRLMKNDKFKKFTERLKKAPRESEPEEAEKKDLRGPICFECSGFRHIRADCGNLKQGKGKAYNETLSDAQDQKFLAFVVPHEDQDNFNPTTLSTVMKTGKNSKRPIKSSMRSFPTCYLSKRAQLIKSDSGM